MENAERMHRKMKKIVQDNTKWRDVIVKAATKKLPPCRCGCMDDPPPDPVCPGKPQAAKDIEDEQLRKRCLLSIQQEIELSRHEQKLWKLKMELERFVSSWASREPADIPKPGGLPSPEQLMRQLQESSCRLERQLEQQYQEELERMPPTCSSTVSQQSTGSYDTTQ
ncbi:uncharacterized protein LOC126482099 [Schistocerca serialis cubense]|uniref:uncharacterized protein LOC126482099 n=1 Tax=Schistocerca serialis cubense TaxID=2023355 RepID=UPI00214F5AA8|nr:uncharacterized protein LOC126482099 [Schistocerca serialis cubense]